MLLAVDGNSLAHRVHHATDPAERDDTYLTAGLVRMLASTWMEGPFEGVLVAFDDPDHNRRKVDHPGYKAGRRDKDETLLRGLGLLPGRLADCGFTVAGSDGVEADDLLAAAADRATDRGWRCTLLSSDRDLTALVSETVTLLRPRRSMARLVAYTPDRVVAEYGVRPEQYTDFAALRGDPSDGLDGVTGVGPKTAARLIRDYGSVPGIYAALGDLPLKLEAALRAGRDDVERNLLLMAPIPGVPVDLDAARAGPDLAAVTDGLDDLGLVTTAAAFRRAVTAPPPPPLPPPPDIEPDLGAATAAATPRPPLRPPAATPATAGDQASLF